MIYHFQICFDSKNVIFFLDFKVLRQPNDRLGVKIVDALLVPDLLFLFLIFVAYGSMSWVVGLLQALKLHKLSPAQGPCTHTLNEQKAVMDNVICSRPFYVNRLSLRCTNYESVLLILHNKNPERIGTQIFQIKVHANLQHKIHQPSKQITKRNCYLSVPLTLSFIFCCYSYIYFRFIISSGLSIHLTTVFAPPNPNVGLRLFEEVLYRVLNMNSWNCSC